jgi:hypothetical protein
VEDGSVISTKDYRTYYQVEFDLRLRYRDALLHSIEAFAPNYGDDVEKFVSDMAIWKDSVERERALLRLNGLDTESLTKMFNTDGAGDDDGDV